MANRGTRSSQPTGQALDLAWCAYALVHVPEPVVPDGPGLLHGPVLDALCSQPNQSGPPASDGY